jgi:polar amino acid transport system permease protein
VSGLPGSAPVRRRIGVIDVVVLVLLVATVLYIGFRVQTVLNYRWNWAPIPQYLFRWDPERGWVANLLVQGLVNTIRLSLWGVVLAILFGVVIGLCRVSRLLVLRLVARTYVELMRNTPPLVLIFVGYFFISSQIMPLLGVDAFVRRASPGTLAALDIAFGDPRLLTNFLAALLCLSLFEGAYVAEIVRAGIQAIGPGQWDAAASLGLDRRRTLRQVILPQAIARMVPPLCGQFISLVKDSSIVSLISIQDLTFMASDIAVSTTRVFEVWLTASAIYFGLCLGLSLLFARLERRFAYALR